MFTPESMVAQEEYGSSTTALAPDTRIARIAELSRTREKPARGILIGLAVSIVLWATLIAFLLYARTS